MEAGIHGYKIPEHTLRKTRVTQLTCKLPIAYVSLLSSIIDPLLPSTETVTRPRLAAREDLDAAANSVKDGHRYVLQLLAFGNTLLPKPIDRFRSVAITSFQRLFAVQHWGAGAVPQNLHVRGGYGGHGAKENGPQSRATD